MDRSDTEEMRSWIRSVNYLDSEYLCPFSAFATNQKKNLASFSVELEISFDCIDILDNK